MKGAHVPFLRQLLSHYRGQDDLVVKNVRGWFQGRPLEEIPRRAVVAALCYFFTMHDGPWEETVRQESEEILAKWESAIPELGKLDSKDPWLPTEEGRRRIESSRRSLIHPVHAFFKPLPVRAGISLYRWTCLHAPLYLAGFERRVTESGIVLWTRRARVRLSSCSTASDLERRRMSATFWRTLGRKGGQSYSQNFRTFPLAHFANTFQAQTRQPLSCTDMPERSLINELFKPTSLRTVLGPQFLRTGFAAIQRTFAREFTSILCVWENAGA